MFYLLSATPRVGSNLLQSLLRRTGVGGDAKEFFCRGEIASLGAKHCGFTSLAEGVERFDHYLAAMRAEYTIGGCFGIKAHFAQFRWALEHGFDLARHFPERFLYLTRGDLVAQAISQVRAMQTGAWTSQKEERAAPSFDPERIATTLRELVLDNQGWETLFQTIHVEPCRLSYEQVVADPPGELARTLRFLDVDPGSVDLEQAVRGATSHFRMQRDELSADWRARYDEYLRTRAGEQSAVMSA